MTFSQRMGITPVRTALQVDSMDDALRNSLWNILYEKVWDPFQRSFSLARTIVRNLWADHLKRAVDAIPDDKYEAISEIRAHFFGLPWNGVYDFIDWIAQDRNINHLIARFPEECNAILAREHSGYRFIERRLVRITSEEEITAIESALGNSDKYKPVSDHLKRALELLASRTVPDCPNSIKESISAVEAMCQIITGSPGATLGQAVKKLEDTGVRLHPAYRDALSKMYGYTSDADGISHALLDESTLDADDARFMLVSCSAFTNYLKAKAS